MGAPSALAELRAARKETGGKRSSLAEGLSNVTDAIAADAKRLREAARPWT